MTALSALQNGFKDALLGGDDTVLLRAIAGSDAATKKKLIGIYRRNMTGNLTEALEQIYPCCMKYMGTEHFLRAARGYVAINPSTCSDLNFYGNGFADFLDQLCRDYKQLSRLTELSNLARLEWHYHAAYYADNDSKFDFTAFAAVDAAQRKHLVFTPSRTLALICTNYRVYELWQYRGDASLLTQEGQTQQSFLCVYRNRHGPSISDIDQAMYRLLEAVLKGEPFNSLCEHCPQVDKLLPQAIEKNWVCGFCSDTEPE